jgi:DNA invertase Pin-like site-specific DNA recombinase
MAKQQQQQQQRPAWVYTRWSTAEQDDGHSLARQEEAIAAYCKRHGLRVERTFVDAGVSAADGANAEGGELGTVLALLAEGRFPKGLVLVVETADRLLRGESLLEGSALMQRILKTGVEVAFAATDARYTRENVRDLSVSLPLAVAQAVASEESRKKRFRLRAVRAAERVRVRAGGAKMTKNGPAWLKLRADRMGWDEVPEKAALVRRVFGLAAEGLSAARIAGVMAAECPGGFTGRGWQPGCVVTLLRSRAVLGEFQPHVGTVARRGGKKSTRRPEGEPVAGYYPVVVDEALFYRVQAALDARKSGGGPTTGTPNLFSGVLHNAVDGCRMVVNSSHGHKVLTSAGAVRKAPGSDGSVIGYEFFERAVLAQLQELKPEDVLGKRPDAAADRVTAAAGKLAALETKIARTQTRAADAEDDEVYLGLLEELGRRKKALAAELEAARAAAACRPGDEVGEFVSLVRLLGDATPGPERDALRRKTRAGLRRVVSAMGVVLASRGDARLGFLQVHFHAGGKPREYVLYYRRGRRGRKSAWSVGSWRSQLSSPLHLPDLRAQGVGEFVRKMLTSDAFDVWTDALAAGATPEGGTEDWTRADAAARLMDAGG